MNLEDIAKQAGVSRSTVSRVVNNEPYVSEQTRQRVLAVIERVGYQPNPGARMLVTQRAQVIGIVIPHKLAVVFQDPYYYPALIQGIVEAAQERDYATLLWVGHSNEDEDRFYQRVLQNRLMDGLVIVSVTQQATILLENLLASETPFVMVEHPPLFDDRINYVSVDNVRAAQTAVNHLIDLGRQRIGHVAGDLNNPDGLARLKGYRDALLAAGLSYDEDLVVEGHFSQRAGYLGMKKLLKQDVDAVFAGNDTSATGVLEALHEAGLRVPQDIAVVGFDDLPAARQASPQLTTIRQPIVQKGHRATSLLLDLLDGTVESPQQILLPTQLVIRQSSDSETF